MELAKKIEIVSVAISSIATHKDDDSVALLAALSAVEASLTTAKTYVVAQAAAEASTALGTAAS